MNPDSQKKSPPPQATPVRNIPPQPSSAPRVLTPRSRRAILMEPRVRRWVYMSGLTLALFAVFCADRLWARHVESELIRTGQKVTATILYAENKSNNQPFSSTENCRLMVHFPNRDEPFDNVHLSDGGMTGHDITLHVDPNNHENWTDRSEPTSLLDSLFVGLIALPILPVVMLFGYLELRKLSRLWESGGAAMAVVFDRKQSPIAPMSYAVRCSMADLRTKALFTVYVPRRGNTVEKGEVIWVIAGSLKQRPLAAAWMPVDG